MKFITPENAWAALVFIGTLTLAGVAASADVVDSLPDMSAPQISRLMWGVLLGAMAVATTLLGWFFKREFGRFEKSLEVATNSLAVLTSTVQMVQHDGLARDQTLQRITEAITALQRTDNEIERLVLDKYVTHAELKDVLGTQNATILQILATQSSILTKMGEFVHREQCWKIHQDNQGNSNSSRSK